MSHPIFADSMIGSVFEAVRSQGRLTNRAQSDWGMDTWELNGVLVGLSDAGYTQSVKWGDRLYVWYTHNSVCDKPHYEIGDEHELRLLFLGITQ